MIGNWFDKDFDIHGPAGPTAYWKISDEVSHAVESDGLDIYGHFTNMTNQADDDDDDGDGEDGLEDGQHHAHQQALLDMLAHFHAHHGGGAGIQTLVNGDGVFMGLHGMGISIQVVHEAEEVEGSAGVLVHTQDDTTGETANFADDTTMAEDYTVSTIDIPGGGRDEDVMKES